MKKLMFILILLAFVHNAFSQQKTDTIYNKVDVMPMYKGGIERMFRDLNMNIKYPTLAKEYGVDGTVYIEFIIDENGKLIDPKVISGPGSGLDEEALRAVSQLNKWSPGTSNGKPVKVYFNIPVKFKIDNPKLKSKESEKIESSKNHSSSNIKEHENVFRIVEEMPEFPGGMEAFYKFIASHLRYPTMAKENGVEGTVYIQIIIDKYGKVINPEVLRGPGGGLDEEALRVIALSPDWKPGKQKGIPVNVYYNIPVKFSMDNTKLVSNKKDFTYDSFDKIPEFPGGVNEMKKFIKDEFKYSKVPAGVTEGTLYVQVVVTTSGKLKNMQIVEGINLTLDKEALRIVSKMPKWDPGVKNGKVINSYYNIPVEFKIPK